MAMKVIAVTGTPGTGKTTLSKKLSNKLDFYYLDVNKVIFKYKLSEGYDRKRRTKIVDIKKLNKKLIEEINKIKNNKKIKGVIIDSHLSHYLPRKYVDVCIVTCCSLKVLKKRLEERGYSAAKIRENLDAEIFRNCLVEAQGQRHRVIEVDTTHGFKRALLQKVRLWIS